VVAAAGECQALLGTAVDRDWRRQVPDMDWTVAETVAHIAEGLLWYATDLAAGPRELSVMDLRVRAETAPADLVARSARSPPCWRGWSTARRPARGAGIRRGLPTPPGSPP
jgi:hypothetical protein